METLKVNLVQSDIIWENPEANFEHINSLISAHGKKADLWVLPEMFSTGFTMNPQECAEQAENNKSLAFLQAKAREHDAAFCASISVEEQGKYYNRLYFVHPDGTYQHYDKRHLFSLAGEEKVYTPGNKRTLVHYRGFDILLQVCYDLRFPVFSRSRADYDMIIYVANWPDRRIHHWDALIPARAIENQAYVIGCNRVGKDIKEIEHTGHSKVLNYNGDILVEMKEGEGISGVELNKKDLLEFRERLNFLKDRDNFRVEL